MRPRVPVLTDLYPDEEPTNPGHSREDEVVYWDKEQRTYKLVPGVLPDAVDVGSAILVASTQLDDCDEARAIVKAGCAAELHRLHGKLAAKAALAISGLIKAATKVRQ